MRTNMANAFATPHTHETHTYTHTHTYAHTHTHTHTHNRHLICTNTRSCPVFRHEYNTHIATTPQTVFFTLIPSFATSPARRQKQTNTALSSPLFIHLRNPQNTYCTGVRIPVDEKIYFSIKYDITFGR